MCLYLAQIMNVQQALDKGLILGMITVLIEVICHNARYANNRYYESDCLSKHVSIKVEGVN
ncbi:hypothetical protein RYU24_03190 [Acinetobacter variabilis]|nr:hypothetical protein RYU24_03190 [Acinetobacter variabilis]